MGGNKYKIGSTIFSMVVTSSKNDRYLPHPTVTADNIVLKKGILAEFANIYDRPKAFLKNGPCFCPPVIKGTYLDNDPHGFPNYTYACYRTNKA